MSNEKFTPGEWEFIGGGIYVGDTHIAEVYSSYNEASDYEEEQEANANLIAAAPEMYEKLKEIQNLFFTFSFRLLKCNEKKNAEQWMKKSMEIAKLLNKARGEE